MEYYDAELIKCKDGSKSFTKDRLNDDFCDCVDGTDEPGILPYFYVSHFNGVISFRFIQFVRSGSVITSWELEFVQLQLFY